MVTQIYGNLKSTVEYNVAANKWEVKHGMSTAVFDRGPDGHSSAIKLAITTDQPLLYRGYEYLKDRYKDNPGILPRAYQGLKLAFDGYVLEPFHGNDEVCRVASRASINEYSVKFRKYFSWPYECTCIDFYKGYDMWTRSIEDPKRPKYGAPYVVGKGIFCKHIFAFMLAAYAGLPLLDYAPDSFIRADAIWQRVRADLKEMRYLNDNAKWLEEIVALGVGRGRLVLTVKENEDLNILRFIRKNWEIRLQESLTRVSKARLAVLLLDRPQGGLG